MRCVLLLIFTVLLVCPADLLADGNDSSAALQARIDAAPAGSVVEVGPGHYVGPIIVKQSLKLVGKGSPVIDGGGKGDVVILAATDSSISGFVIRGSGDSLDFENCGVRVLGARTIVENNRFEDVLFGIDLKNASNCRISNNHITSKALDIARRGDALRLFRSNDCLIEGNVIEDGRDALLWYSNHIVVRKNVSRRNRYGFHMMYSNDVTLEDNEISDNSVGIYLMYGKTFRVTGNKLFRNRGPSGYGLGLKEVDAYEIRNNLIIGNRVGTYIDGSPFTRKVGSRFTRNIFACNDIGMSLLPAVKGNRIDQNNFIDNIEQLAVLGRGSVKGNEFSHEGKGNYWSDYGGYDANHDGVGDQVYQSRKLFESLIDREPKLRLLLMSPAHDAIEFIGRAMPAVKPEAKFSDTHPLTAPVDVMVPASQPANRTPMLWLAAVLLALPAMLFFCVFERPRFICLAESRGPWRVCHDQD